MNSNNQFKVGDAVKITADLYYWSEGVGSIKLKNHVILICGLIGGEYSNSHPLRSAEKRISDFIVLTLNALKVEKYAIFFTEVKSIYDE